MVRTQAPVVPRSGTWVEAPADRPVGRDHGPGRLGESHGPRERSFDPCAVLGYPEGQQKVGLLGTPGRWTRQRPPSGFVICLITKALFSLCRAFAHPCNRESIGVALALTV
jgi:hypothetical protein